jgi:hypothetical protein
MGLDTTEQLRQTLLQPFGNLFDVHERYIPDSSLDTAVVSPMQPASLRSLFLIDLLLLAYATNRAAETDADVEGHED